MVIQAAVPPPAKTFMTPPQLISAKTSVETTTELWRSLKEVHEAIADDVTQVDSDSGDNKTEINKDGADDDSRKNVFMP